MKKLGEIKKIVNEREKKKKTFGEMTTAITRKVAFFCRSYKSACKIKLTLLPKFYEINLVQAKFEAKCISQVRIEKSKLRTTMIHSYPAYSAHSNGFFKFYLSEQTSPLSDNQETQSIHSGLDDESETSVSECFEENRSHSIESTEVRK